MTKIHDVIHQGIQLSGLQRVCSYINRHKLSILCFHSMSVEDEHCFWPGVFISKKKLCEILDYLRDSRYQVISLTEAKKHLRGEVLYEYPVVITIDDGWYRSVVDMLPILERYRFHCTLYVTTYYVSHQIAVVNVILQYMLWKSNVTAFSLCIGGTDYEFSGSHQNMVNAVESIMINRTDSQKERIIYDIANALGIDTKVIELKLFQNASREDIRNAFQSPLVDFQLHTHIHSLPKDENAIRKQIIKNKELLEDMLDCKGELNDFCYPSGLWHPSQIPHLESLSIETATTLDEGLNAIGDHPLKLNRSLIMDNRSLTHIKLTLSGVLDVIRRLKAN